MPFPRRLLINLTTLCAVHGTIAAAEPLRSANRVTAPADGTALDGGVCPDVRFWIVSTRRCSTSGSSRSRRCCRFHYLACDRCTGIRASSRGEFMAGLDPAAPTCIFIHGSFVRWQGVIYDSIQTNEWLRRAAPARPMNFVVFTWPSDRRFGMFPQIDVGILGRIAARQGFHLARVISEVPAGSPVCLLAHSHGARIAASALHLLGGGAVQGNRYCGHPVSNRLRAVFAAAAFDHHWLNPGERYGCAVHRVECVLNLRNRRDLPLMFYTCRKPFFSRHALARSGFTQRDRLRLGRWGLKLSELDVTHLIGRQHTWPGYYANPSLACSISGWFHFPRTFPASGVREPSVATNARTRPARSRRGCLPQRTTARRR